VPEDEFLERLGALSRRLGLEMEVFSRSSGLENDAKVFGRARVVIGPHGGAFTNISFLDPNLNPVIIESNLHRDFFDCCQSSLRKSRESPRNFFGPLSSSLGFRYVAHQPHIWEGYDFDAQVRLEVNEYLQFVEDTVRGVDAVDHLSAPFHPCLEWFK